MLALPAKPRLTSLRARFTIKALHNRELCITALTGPEAVLDEWPLWPMRQIKTGAGLTPDDERYR